ncbi:putative stage V sporulation protein E [Lachnoanaerobaculum sp. MSX33]|uniref:FtsW/RodA/SpoVE family cell cycle protein n=1 Tax=Lachnoanaerobaculum sp. MSX33 TaxID=936596 RepID=UPI0003DF9801|nr:putative peptidoglycan glycosyltransferase FtsW [Lachnoanaerobaculum sp. MSX33]ETO97136.1 putative stage V sporulation protein E [Lachnoanaerobaculum sp. MSX33]
MADDIKKNKAKIKNVAKKELKNQAVKRKIKVEKGGQKKTKVDTAKENKIRKIGVKKPVVNDSKKNETKKRRFYDYSLIFTILFLLVLGLIMIYSASSYTADLKFKNSAYFVNKQLIFVVAGLILMIFVSIVPYQVWIKLSKLIYVVATALVGAVLVIGRDANGARRWINLFGIKFQPSEFVKVAIIIFSSYYLVKYKNDLHSTDRKVAEKKLWFLFGVIFVPTVLVMVENLSTSIIIFLIAFCMSFLGTSNKRLHTVGAIAMGVILFFSKPFVKFIYERGARDYHLTRLLVWAEPEKFSRDGGYQVIQGLYAIGSGSFFGKGLGQGMQKFFLPESQNDMIFAIIVEELGLFGAGLIMGAFVFLIYRMIKISFSVTDPEGVYLVVGILIHLSLQVILNIAVVTGVLPNTGVSLPFISYGGTSILVLLGEMGIVLSVARSIKLDY